MPIPKPINQVTGEPSWRWRRIVALWTIAFCQIMLLRLIDKQDSALNYVIAVGSTWAMVGMAFIYTGFASVQDFIAIFVTKSGRPYAEPISGTVETKTVETKTVTPDPTATPAVDPKTVPPEGFAGQ